MITAANVTDFQVFLAGYAHKLVVEEARPARALSLSTSCHGDVCFSLFPPAPEDPRWSVGTTEIAFSRGFPGREGWTAPPLLRRNSGLFSSILLEICFGQSGRGLWPPRRVQSRALWVLTGVFSFHMELLKIFARKLAFARRITGGCSWRGFAVTARAHLASWESLHTAPCREVAARVREFGERSGTWPGGHREVLADATVVLGNSS